MLKTARNLKVGETVDINGEHHLLIGVDGVRPVFEYPYQLNSSRLSVIYIENVSDITEADIIQFRLSTGKTVTLKYSGLLYKFRFDTGLVDEFRSSDHFVVIE